MGFFTAKVYPATLGDRSKISKERLEARAEKVQRALEGPMPRAKKKNLVAELSGILRELDARQETVDRIVAKFDD